MFEDDFAASPGASQASAGTGSFVFGNSMQDDQGKDSADHMDEDIAKLRDALWNEKASPEILPFEEGIVEDLMELVEHQQGVVDESGETVEEKFKSDLYQREIDRVVYMLKSYLRTRLIKITRHAKYILSQPELQARLSEAEAELVAKPYANLVDNHLERSFLNNLPKQLRKLKGKHGELSLVPEPDLNEYIFCHVLESLGQVEILDESLDMQAGEIFAVRYNTIKEFLSQGKVHLV